MLRALLNRIKRKVKVYSTSDLIRGAMSSGRKDQQGQWYRDI